MEQTKLELKRILSSLKEVFLPHFINSKKLFESPIFWILLILKCIAAFFLASTFATELFIPFVKYFVTQNSISPYTFFYTHGIANAFPYSSVMLWFLSVPYFVSTMFGASSFLAVDNIDLLLLRIPLLIADFGILVLLASWFEKRHKELLWLYWSSPILFYITYIHGQLDVVPVFFLFAFLYFLFKEYDTTAFIFLGLAIASKIGMVVVLPFAVLYLYKERTSLANTITTLTIPVTTYLLLNIAYLHETAFTQMVFKTKEGFKVFDLVLTYGNTLVLYIVPLIMFVLFAYFATLTRYSRNVFMTFLGFSFFVLLLCIPPRQGWYFWIIPFAVYFYMKKPWKKWMPFFLLSFAYLFYFALIKESDYFSLLLSHSFTIKDQTSFYALGVFYGLPMDTIVSIAFTFLQSVLLLNVYAMYKDGVALYTKHKLYYKPFLLGVAGDSGSGKTTLTELLTGIFSTRNTTVIAGDDMHKWERGNHMWQEYTHLDPLANELHSDIKNIYAVKQADSISRKHYDHGTGMFTKPKVYEAKRLTIFEGLHAFFLEKVRNAFDVKIYVAPEEQLRLHWKIIRDSIKRGHTKEQTLATLEKRKDDSEKFIAVQEKHADIVISFRNNVSLGKSIGEQNVTLSLSLFISCVNDIHLQPLLDELVSYFTIDYLIHDEKQRIKFTGDIDAKSVKGIAEKLLTDLDDISTEERIWNSGYEGIIQLFVTFYIFQKLTLEEYDK